MGRPPLTERHLSGNLHTHQVCTTSARCRLVGSSALFKIVRCRHAGSPAIAWQQSCGDVIYLINHSSAQITKHRCNILAVSDDCRMKETIRVLRPLSRVGYARRILIDASFWWTPRIRFRTPYVFGRGCRTCIPFG